MAQVLVRDIEPAVIDRLKTMARDHGRSLESELRIILKQAVGSTPVTDIETLERVRALFEGRSFSNSADMIREDRNR
jgi:hypothetical protein